MNRSQANFNLASNSGDFFRSDQRIGRLLVDNGRLEAADVDKVLRVQKEWGLLFGEAAQKLKLVSINDVQQALAEQFDYPYLAPEEASFAYELVTAYQPFSIQAEAIRAARSQLALKWFNEGHRTLAVVGAEKGEGCSYLAANLAVAFSQLGTKTLLVDTNLREPRQHEIFRATAGQGLSHVLVGKAALDAVIQPSTFNDLWLLPAGTVPPNPLELLSRPTLIDVVNYITTQYSVIIFDTAPASFAADAQIVSAAAKGALIVARKNITRWGWVQALQNQLQAAASISVGVVLNEF